MAAGSLMETLLGSLDGGTLERIGRQLGTDRSGAETATRTGIATLVGALARNAAGGGDGAAALHRAIERDHDGGILDDLGGFLGDPARGDGAKILGHVLGGRRDRVEQGLGAATGLDAAKAGGLLEMLAPVVLGALGRRQRAQGLDSAGLANLLGGEREHLESAAPGAGGLLGSLLDADGDGDFDAGDAARHGAKLLGKLFRR